MGVQSLSVCHPPLDPHMGKPMLPLLSLTDDPYEVCSRIYVSVVLFVSIHGMWAQNQLVSIVVTKE